MRRYGLIIGQGRSGTNWLLQLFDFSRETFCRNEPDECRGSRFLALADARDRESLVPERAGELWDAAVDAALSLLGERDHRARVAKLFLYEPARRLGLYRALRSPRFRRAASTLVASLGAGEFPLPRCVGSSARLRDSFGVLKLNMAPGLAAFVLRARPEVPVFHIVRHPGGYLSSWSTRYLASAERTEVERANRARIEAVRRDNPAWATRIPDPQRLDTESLELWYWRFANEVIYAAGRARPAYYLVSYEELTRNPVATMRPLYAACGLAFTPEMEAAVGRTAAASREIAGKWRERLDEHQKQLVEAALKDLELPVGES